MNILIQYMMYGKGERMKISIKHVLCSLFVVAIMGHGGTALGGCTIYNNQSDFETDMTMNSQYNPYFVYPTHDTQFTTYPYGYECSTVDIAGYYLDTGTNKYITPQTCTQCATGFAPVENTTSYGDCNNISYTTCALYCSLETTQPSGAQQASSTNPYDCSSTSTSYLFMPYANSYIRVNSCSSCPTGYYLYSEEVNFGGQYDADSCKRTWYTCAECNAGSYSSTNNATSCSPCPTGTWSGAGASSCTPCPDGSTNSGTGNTQQSSCCLTNLNSSDSTGSFTYSSPCCYDN